MTINISIQAQNIAGTTITDLIDSGSTNPNGYIEIWDGVRPTTPQDTISGTLLAVLNFSNPAFNVFANGTALANLITDDVDINNSGIAKWFRIYDRDGNSVIDGTITDGNGNGDIKLDDVNFIKGGIVTIDSLTATMSI